MQVSNATSGAKYKTSIKVVLKLDFYLKLNSSSYKMQQQ